jgi:glycosyltransferase involved in cell wall biosynthesis
MLRRDFNAAADHFQFPVDRSIYYPRVRTKANRNLVFFAKPEMPRRCFELGVIALREFHQLRPDVEIVMFGSKHASKQSYDFPVTIREVLPTLNDLAQMYSDGDVGLVFSTTNPSLIPYEMMACGLPVIDLARADNEVNYAGRRDIALLADPQPHIMAEQIAELIGSPAGLADRREKGLDFVNGFPSEEGMARRIEALILDRLAKLGNGEISNGI